LYGTPWSGYRSSICPASATPSPSGCGPRPPALPQPMWTAGGRRSCAASTSNTPSECSNRPSAGPARASAPRPPPTAGPGCSSPHTPSYDWPGPSSPTCADPGNAPPARAASPQRESAAAFGTPARRPPCRPEHPNPAEPVQDARRLLQPAARTRYDVGKTVKRDLSITARQQRTG